nr:MAG TPA: hypothetical protein [Caudoviricetes sp.]
MPLQPIYSIVLNSLPHPLLTPHPDNSIHYYNI